MTIDSTIGVVFNYSEYYISESNKFYLYYKTELDVETSLQTIELLTTSENFDKISQIVFSQIYGFPVNLTFTDSSKIISYFINNTDGIKVFNVVVTLIDQTQYILKVKIDAITTTGESSQNYQYDNGDFLGLDDNSTIT